MNTSDKQPSPGFQMTARRTLLEIGGAAAVLGGAIIGVLWLANRSGGFLTDYVPRDVDRAIGEQAAKAVAMGATVCTDPGPQRYVEGVAAPLLRALDDRSFEFRFTVVDDPEVNAFALPGGFVTVNMGLLTSAEHGDEVAAVLAHEMQHVVRRHGTRRMLRELGATALLSILFGGTDVAVPASITHDFVSNGYDRDQEREADARGLSVLVRAGIDPRGMARFFERLAKTSVAPPALLSTHPDPGDRAEEADRAGKGAKITTVLPDPKGLKCK